MILTPELSYETDCRFHVPRKGSYLGRKLELSFLQDIEIIIMTSKKCTLFIIIGTRYSTYYKKCTIYLTFFIYEEFGE